MTGDGSVVEFGRWVRSQRVLLLLTQEQLAERANLSVRTIRNIEAASGGSPRGHTRAALILALAPEREAPTHVARPPSQLPADVADFVGRDAELAHLDELLYRHGRPGVSPAVLITGAAGTGKTALAVHWAHGAGRAFPGGMLHADLRGYDPSRPVEPTFVLRGFLVALGVDEQSVPASLDARSALFRTRVSGRRLLVLLDNVAAVDQVRPLLPGAATCATLITSRDALPGLVVRNDVRRVELGLLPEDEALELLAVRVGTRAETELDQALALVARCGRLPLALCIAAERAAAQPMTSLAVLVDEFDRQRSRLDLLDLSEDRRTALRSVFSWSLRHLSVAAIGVFEAFGLHPTGDVDVPSAAALAGVEHTTALRALDVLTQAHLVGRTAIGRYHMHDLVREYARERVARWEDAQRAAALRRLSEHLLAASAHAMTVLGLAADEPATDGDPMFHTIAGAAAWLDAELATLVAIAPALRAHQPKAVLRLAETVGRYFDVGGYYAESVELQSQALEVSRAAENISGEANAHRFIGIALYRIGRTEEALGSFRTALDLFSQLGALDGESWVLANLGALHRRLGHYDVALDFMAKALERFRDLRDRSSESKALDSIGLILHEQGRWEEAREQHRGAVEVARAAGDRLCEAISLDNLGMVHLELGDVDEAVRCLERAGDFAREFGDRLGEAATLTHLASVDDRRGRSERAIAAHQKALSIARQIGERDMESEIEDALGAAHLHLGLPDVAVDHFRRAQSLADQTGDRFRRANARIGLGQALVQATRFHEAVAVLNEAKAIAGANDHHRGRAVAALAAAKTASQRA